MRRKEKVGVQIEHAALAEAHAAVAVRLAAVGIHHWQHVVEHSRALEVVAKQGSVGRLKEEVGEEGDDQGNDEQD